MLLLVIGVKRQKDPLQAQNELCTLVGEFTLTRKKADRYSEVDFWVPAIHWKSLYSLHNMYKC